MSTPPTRPPSPRPWYAAAGGLGAVLVLYTVVIVWQYRGNAVLPDPRINHVIVVLLTAGIVTSLMLGFRREWERELESRTTELMLVLGRIVRRLNDLHVDTGDLAIGVGRKVAQDEAARAEIAQLRVALAASDHDRDILIARMREDMQRHIAAAVADAYRRGMVTGAEEEQPLRLVPPRGPAQSGRS